MSALNLPEAIESLKLPLIFDSFLLVMSVSELCRDAILLFTDLHQGEFCKSSSPENWVVMSEPRCLCLHYWPAPAVELQTQTGNGISVGDGGGNWGQRGGPGCKFEQYLKVIFLIWKQPGAVWLSCWQEGQGRNVEREISFQSWDLNTTLRIILT